jgi:hypothetical protein
MTEDSLEANQSGENSPQSIRIRPAHKHSAPLGRGQGWADPPTNILPRWGRDNVRPTRLQTFRPAGAGTRLGRPAYKHSARLGQGTMLGQPAYKHSAPLGRGQGWADPPTNILPRWGRGQR